MVYFLLDLQTSNYKEFQVKTFLRKGKVVKSYKRKTKNKLVRNFKVFAGILGLSVASYIVTRRTYRANMVKTLAKAEKLSLKLNPILPKNTNSVTFVMPGFTGQKNLISSTELFEKEIKKIVPKTHTISVDSTLFNTKNYFDFKKEPKKWLAAQVITTPLLFIETSLKKGYNPVSQDILSQAIAINRKYPNVKINIIGGSGAGLAIRETSELMTIKNLNHKYITLGSPYLGITRPSKKGIEIIGEGDFLMKITPSGFNTKRVNDVYGHYVLQHYLKSNQTKKIIKDFFSESSR